MSLFRCLRTPKIYIRKEPLYTSLTVESGADKSQESTQDTKRENRSLKGYVRNEASVETSIEYMQSSAYKKAYGDLPVWTYYRRNFKGQFPPETRENCVTKGVINNASPCPICRDEYLTIDYRNIDLIKQFISPYGGEMLTSKKTGVCQFQYRKLLVEITKAKDYGLLSFDVPHRHYNYNLYCKSKLIETDSKFSKDK